MSVASAIDSGLSYVLPGYGAEGAPPGVAGPASAGQPVVYDPGTGLYVNQATGAISTDPAGRQVVQDPSLATQATRNLATSGQFLSQLGEYGKQYSGAQANENALGAHLNATIAGTAPSAAQTQLEQGLGQISQQQQSAASGATGESGALARQNAMANIASASAKTNQGSAGLRTQEVAGAENAEGTLLGNEANQALTATGQGETAAGNFSNLAGGEQGNQATLTQSGGKNQLTSLGSIAGAAGSAAGVTSDVDEKTDIKPADTDDFMSKLAAATGGKGGIEYDYKHPGEPGQSSGRKLGVPAQALQTSKIGKKIVKSDGNTLKLNHGEMLGAIMASLARLHETKQDKA